MTRTTLFSVCLAAVIGTAQIFLSAGTAFSGPASFSDLAPADEYFGREHMSPLAIRHRIFSLKDDLHHGRRQPGDVEHGAGSVQDALQDWSSRFPRDPWIASAAWNLATLYEELPGTGAQKSAVALLQFVRAQYSQTQFAAYAAHDLTRGVGVRPYPRSSAEALLQSILAVQGATPEAMNALTVLENQYWTQSANGNNASYVRCAWELAAAYERQYGEDARTRAVRLLALLVDRYPSQTYGGFALRDLKRGVGLR